MKKSNKGLDLKKVYKEVEFKFVMASTAIGLLLFSVNLIMNP